MNGCTCAAVRQWQRSNGVEQHPPEWRCIACTGRAKATVKCRGCGIGLFDSEAEGPERLCWSGTQTGNTTGRREHAGLAGRRTS